MGEEIVRVGCGSAGSGQREDVAVTVVEEGDVDYLCCDRLAERTLANLRTRMLTDAHPGYDPRLEPWFRSLIPKCAERGTKIIGSFGGANIDGAAERIAAIAREEGYPNRTIASIHGDDVRKVVAREETELTHLVDGDAIGIDSEPLIANAYLGTEGIVAALAEDADIIIGGRIADLSLFLAPMIHEFGWTRNDLDTMAQGAAVAHLLECGEYATGANLHQPGTVEVPDLDDLALPLAEITPAGDAVVTKPEETGGVVNELSVGVQLGYEIHDPEHYASPDLVVDVSEVELTQEGPDRVRVSGAKGKPRPECLKVLVGERSGYLIQIEGSWAGSDSLAKAEATRDEILKPALDRWDQRTELLDYRFGIIGVDSIHGPESGDPDCEPNEVRLRFAARVHSETAAQDLIHLMTVKFWPSCAGVGGVQSNIQPNIKLQPTSLPRSVVDWSIRSEPAFEMGGSES